MKKSINKILSAAIVLFFLPYMVTIFINGRSTIREDDKNPYIKIMIGNEEKNVLAEDYLTGLVAKEVDPFYEYEMIKAQSVITRTNLYRKGKYTEGYITCHDMKKKWGNETGEKIYKKIKKAVRETERQVLLFNGKPIQASFHSLSNGKTRNGKEVFSNEDYPYLVSKECPKDIESPFQIQTLILTYDEIKEYCRPILKAVEKEETNTKFCFEDFTINEKDSTGYVMKIGIKGQLYSGEEFREVLDLPSSCFSFQDQEGKFKITIQGMGHGLGMSQFTANEMAKEGKKYNEILSYFYEGTELKEVVEIL